MTELYESIIGEEKLNSSWVQPSENEENESENENSENICDDSVESKIDTQMDEIEVPEPVVEPDHNDVAELTFENAPKDPSLFTCFFAVIRALCGYK